jgi:DNA-binding NtrC family response regulator
LSPARSILVVDDEEAIRNALKRSLEHEGYSVHVAGAAEEALAWLKGNEVQLIISDNMMPKMTGLEFLGLVRDRYPQVCRILLTAHADLDVAMRAINEGAIYRLLEKPWHDLELKVMLHVAFEQLDLEAENRKLLATVQHQGEVIRALEKEHPGILKVVRGPDGAVLVSDAELAEMGFSKGS